MPTVLAVGCGPDPMQEWRDKGYQVVRLDADPSVQPDVVASMTSLGDIGPFDVVYCSHALEHLYPHEVPRALSEFHRVLGHGGKAVILVPDLQDVPATDDPLPGSDLTGLHLYYGDSSLIEANPFMAHHSGFVEATLSAAMKAAGFEVSTQRMGYYNLLGMGVKS